MNLFRELEDYILSPLPVNSKRMPTFYPSAASCRDIDDPTKIHGACMRAQWFRCAGFKESNPSTAYNQYIFAAGNMWESWLNEKMKEMGIWLGNSIKFSIEEYYISGEIDILVKDRDGSPVIIENKTYNGSNYQAKAEICGLAGRRPTPKYSNAMQAALYLTYFSKPENGGVNKVWLTYMDRSCSGPDAQKQYTVTLSPEDGRTFIHLDVDDAKGASYSYNLPGVTMEGIFDRYNELMTSLQSSLEKPPTPDFMHIYPAEVVEQMYSDGEIAKTNYEKWKGNPDKNPIGYYMCRNYCGYRDLCKKYKDIDGHL